ncbi:MAG: SDR family oxidoreductase [Bacteroidota bacterium]
MFSKSIKDKVVIITGASSGIGLAIAREFSSLGAKVVIASRSEDKLKQIEQDLCGKGFETMAVKTDVTVEAECKMLIEHAVKRFGRIDALINNAGISMRALFTEVQLDVLRKLMDVNFWGTVQCTKYALPYLIESHGTLVGISSVAGFHGLPGRTGYSASKFAMHGFLESLRIENMKNGLHVLLLSAGFTASNIRNSALMADGSTQGSSPRNESKLMPAEKVAKVLLRAIQKRKRNKILTVQGKLAALFQRIVPTVVDWGAYREFAREPDSPFK